MNDDLTQLALNDIYGLLDGPAAEAARERLATPEGCEARRQAEQFHAMLSAAAKLQFPDVRFAAPALASRPQHELSMRWVGWVVAASALFAVSIPGAAGLLESQTRARQAEDAQFAAGVARKEFTDNLTRWQNRVELAVNERSAAAAELDHRQTELAAAVEQAQADVRNKQFNVVVSGPVALTPGAPNHYRIETQDLAGKPVAAKLATRVVDQLGRAVYEPAVVATGGKFDLKLPADLPLTPDRDLSLEVVATGPAGPAAVLKQELPLAAPVYLAHLTTDKPMYQPGETVRYRALVLDRAKLQPPSEDLTLTLSVLDPQGAELDNQTGVARLADGKENRLRGLAAGQFTLNESAPGGEYTVRLREASGRTPEQTRKFLVNKYQPATLEKKLEFTRKSYGPGDEVVAACSAARVNGPLANQPVSAAAQVDGKSLNVECAKATDAKGNVLVKFRLPAEIDRGAASVSVTFTDGGAVETLNKPVPVVVKKLDVEFYPEGGDLIAGVPNRVYLQARTPLGKPAEMKGKVIDSQGKTVADVETLNDDREPGINQGEARFAFTPLLGEKYRLQVMKPEGITSVHDLPMAKASGVVLNTGAGVSTDREPLPLSLTVAGPERKLIVGAYARGRLLDHQRLLGIPGKTEKVVLNPPAGYGGVTRITVFEEKGDGPTRQLIPVAERLVYRAPSKKLEVTASADKTAYAPGEKAALKITAKDENGKATPAIAMLGVVNQSVVVMADEKSFRTMPTHFLLTGEVEKAEDLEHIDVVLGPHPKAAAALDLLLGVQGWRRFVESGEMPIGREKIKTGLMVAASPHVRQTTFDYAAKSAASPKEPALRAAAQKAEAAEENLAKTVEEPASLVALSQKAQRAESVAAEVAAARDAAAKHWSEVQRSALPWATILPLLAACGLALTRKHFFGAIGCFIIAGAAGFGWVSLSSATPTEVAKVMQSTAEPAADAPRPEFGFDVAPQAARGIDRLERGRNRDLGGFGVGPEGRTAGKTGLRMDPAAKAANGSISGGIAGGGGGVFKGGNVNGFAGGFAGGHKDNLKLGAPEAKRLEDAGAALGKPQAPAPAAPENAPRGEVVLGRKVEVAPGLAAADKEAKKRGSAKPTAAPVPPAPVRAAALAGRAAEAEVLNRNAAVAALQQPPAEALMYKRRGAVADQPLKHPIEQQLHQLRDGDEYAIYKGLMGGRLLRQAQRAPFVVREYAHVHKPAADGVRNDFAETIYWHPALIVPGEGVTASFDLSDAVTRYQVLAAVHTLDGRLGAVKSAITARKPIAVEPKLPVELTAGDRIDMPVTISNETDRPRDVILSVETPGLAPVGPQPALAWSQPANSRSRRVFGFRPLNVEGVARVKLQVAGEDAIERVLPVVPEGFPVQGQLSDELHGSAKGTITLPATWVPGTLKCEVAMYPTPLADLQRGLEGLLQEPGGCFEQTSTTNYPNALILNYLQETNQANPEAVAKARGMLDRGYKRLTSFEVPQDNMREGYEWFGHAPAHEALTAYGLLQFRDMARVADVDPAMIARTRHYLLTRRDGHGGFQRSQVALDSFGRANEQVTNAYIVWAITESGKDDDVNAELDRLQREAQTNRDPYFLALVANALWNRDRQAAAQGLLGQLVALQGANGSVAGTSRSITGSQGQPLQIETTALAILGWLKANQPGEFGSPLRKAVKWMGQQRQGTGSFGPTQSTILALKALVAYSKANKQPPEAGNVTFRLGDQVLATMDYTADRLDAIVLDLPDAEKWLKPGDNAVTVATTGKNAYPYTVAWSYQTLQPPSAAGCAVKLTTGLAKSELNEGEATRMHVGVDNVSKKGQGMTVAIIGLPAGLSLPDDFKQLRDLARVVDGKPGPIAFWELRGRELVLYWRDMAPDAKVNLDLDVIARVPGRYRGPASRAYLYYDPAAKSWTAPLAAQVKAAE